MRADRVFVHGFTQTSDSWEPVVEVLGSRAEAGVSLEIFAQPSPTASFVDAARALGKFDATYVGYSMGGRLCLQLALDRPEHVERLVLISASPGIADDAERAARRESDEGLAREIERDGVDAFLERWLAQPLFATLPRELAGVDDRRAANTVETLTHQLRAFGQGAQPDNWGRLDELGMPVLLIAGALDPKYVDIANRMSAAIPNARVEIVDGAGHACHLERPEVVSQLLASW